MDLGFIVVFPQSKAVSPHSHTMCLYYALVYAISPRLLQGRGRWEGGVLTFENGKGFCYLEDYIS